MSCLIIKNFFTSANILLQVPWRKNRIYKCVCILLSNTLYTKIQSLCANILHGIFLKKVYVEQALLITIVTIIIITSTLTIILLLLQTFTS